MKNKRKICIISGKRGGFGSLIRTMKLIQDDPVLELQLIVTDMHVSDKFGKTLKEVEKYFPISAYIDMEQQSGNPAERSRAMGVCLKKITNVLEQLKPDILLCLGDRGETLVTVIAALNLHIPVAHIQGGDISGNLDEYFRHAITKMSHIHFPSTKESAERILRMGEHPDTIHVVGDAHVDLIKNNMYTDKIDALRNMGVPLDKKYQIVLMHPVNTEGSDAAYEKMKNVLQAAKSTDYHTVLVYPCSDQGYDGIIKAIEEYRDDPNFTIRINIEAEDFLGLMSGAELLIGNSSSGIIETPAFQLPTINIGRRQLGRLRDVNVIDIEGNDEQEIYDAIVFALNDTDFKDSLKKAGKIYGDGTSAEKIVNALKKLSLDRDFFEKRMTY